MAAFPSLSAHLKAFVIGVVLAAAGLGVYSWLSQPDATSLPSADSPYSSGEVEAPTAGEKTLPPVAVYKNPQCGCCDKWVDHLRANGFAVTVEEAQDMGAVKQEHGVPRQLTSCHTATVGGYVVEGHVPAGDIKRMLRQQPEMIGLAVPGMPVGSPGMEQGARLDPYDVLAFREDSTLSVFAQYRPRG